MSKIIASVLVLTGLVLCTVLGGAASYSLGSASLTADIIELDNLTVKASGNTRLVAKQTSQMIAPGTIHLDSIRADNISIDLVRDKQKALNLKQAVATRNVVIKARRADRETDNNGKPIVIIRNIDAVAQKAQFLRDEDKLILTGNVNLKVLEPGNPQPIAELSGETVVYYLKQNRIEIKGQSGKQPELTVGPKGGE